MILIILIAIIFLPVSEIPLKKTIAPQANKINYSIHRTEIFDIASLYFLKLT